MMEIIGIKNVYKRIDEIHKKIHSIQGKFNYNNLKVYQHTSEIENKNNPIDKPERKREDREKNKSTSLTKKDILNLIENISNHEGVNSDLIKAIIQVESNFDPDAISNKGAEGLMQLMPETANLLNIDSKNPIENIYGGIKYLKYLAKKYKDLDLVLAAYNAGPGNVDKYKGIPPFVETQTYIKKIKKILKQFED